MIDTAKYEAELKRQLEELITELNTLGIQNPDNPNDWIATPIPAPVTTADPNEVADRAEDWGEERATTSALEIRYANIKRALKKIEDGTYGVCEISGNEIETDRLDANPAARTDKANIEEEKNLPVGL